ncbi:hypothetical protein BDW_09940 [Bdellovibrio bacteriovorus W]|nr:hypothetical protein BDW_09940 [Bdellovibrio bacteriovorus W]
MFKKMLLATSLIFSTWTIPSQASSFKIEALVDSESLRTHLAIPFAVRDTPNTVKVNSVQVVNGASCRTMIDPFKEDNFFVKCLEEGGVVLSVTYTINGVVRSTKYGPFPVVKISQTGKVIDTNDKGPSPELLKGQELWSKSYGNYQSCASCHGSASSKSHSISLGSLNSAYTSTRMKTDAIPLSAEEKNAIILYVKSRK